MDVSRRGFLKLSGATLAASGLGISLSPSRVHAKELKTIYTKESLTVCPYCSVGCGIIVSVRDGKVINTEGDPDHPINEGSLCSKGQSVVQISNNPNRMRKVRYRPPGSTKWEEKDWHWAMHEIATRVKETRDRTFKTTNKDGLVVNRTEAIASLGGAALDNEECYVVDKLMRALGIVYLEQQARL